MLRMRVVGLVLAVVVGLGMATGPVRVAAQPATPLTFGVVGTETSTGTVERTSRQGVTFVGTASGPLSGQVSIVVAYAPARPVCGGANQLLSGRWSVQTPSGALTGTVLSGQVQFDPFCAFGLVTAQLAITEGTGAYAGAVGSGTVSMVLNHLPLLIGQPATLAGQVDLAVILRGTGPRR